VIKFKHYVLQEEKIKLMKDYYDSLNDKLKDEFKVLLKLNFNTK